MKLISMTDFVIEIEVNEPEVKNFISMSHHTNYKAIAYPKIISYANFLKRKLELGFFVPCDKGGNVMLIPREWKKKNTPPNQMSVGTYSNPKYAEYIKEFNEAKSRVLFEGLEVYKYPNGYIEIMSLAKYSNMLPLYIHDRKSFNIKNIEELVDYNLTLTQKAIDNIK